jgi:hypothetical protein
VRKAAEPPKWIKPQLTGAVDEAPAGNDWLHEIKYDGYRMHARLDRGRVQLLTRTGLDWSRRYPRTVEVLRSLLVKTAYLDGELCALRPDGVPAFSRLQAAMDEGRTDDLVFIVFDLLYLNGKARPHCRSSIARSGCRHSSSVRSAGCGSATMSWAMAGASSRRPVGWASKASYPSAWTGPMRPTIGGSG